MDALSKYIEEKKRLNFRCLKSRVETEKRFLRCTGGRCLFGFVRVTAVPSSGFSFQSLAKWPSENYDGAILTGVLDILLPAGTQPILGLSVTVNEIKWHEIDSCYFGYYEAAKAAAQDIIGEGNLEVVVSNG